MSETRVVIQGLCRVSAQPLTVAGLREAYREADAEVRRLRHLSLRGWNAEADARAIYAAERIRESLHTRLAAAEAASYTPPTIDELRAQYREAEAKVRRIRLLALQGWTPERNERAIRAATERRDALLRQIVEA